MSPARRFTLLLRARLSLSAYLCILLALCRFRCAPTPDHPGGPNHLPPTKWASLHQPDTHNHHLQPLFASLFLLLSLYYPFSLAPLPTLEYLFPSILYNRAMENRATLRLFSPRSFRCHLRPPAFLLANFFLYFSSLSLHILCACKWCCFVVFSNNTLLNKAGFSCSQVLREEKHKYDF